MGERKKLFVISDIHGHYTLMRQALDDAGFDSKDPQHLLVCCGDYFDRGKENLKVLQYLDRIENKVMLRGNHEDMLLKVFYTGRMHPHNYLNGTVETVVELFGKYALDDFGNVDFTGKTRMLDRITDFILEGIDYFETSNYVFVHGWLPIIDGKIPADWRHSSAQSWERARWRKWLEEYDGDRLDGKTIVCGHYPTLFAHHVAPERNLEDAGIFYGNGVIVVDAGTYSSGQVNVLVLEDTV